MLADLAGEIGGEYVSVSGLMGPGVDPHLYQAGAGDVAKLRDAGAVLYNGLRLEGKMGDILERLEKQGKTIVCIEKAFEGGELIEAEGGQGQCDPHVWYDISLWRKAAGYLCDSLCEMDPANAPGYAENLNAYLAELDALETYVRSRAQEIPAERRVLVTAHDAFRYFGRAYGFEVMGLQGLSTDAEAGTSDISALADVIADRQIKAVFTESSVSGKAIEALCAAVRSRGFEVSVGGELYSDSLGDEAAGTGTYILTFRANIDAVTDALK